MSWDVGNLWSSGRDGMGRKDSDNQEKNLTTRLSISVQNMRSSGDRAGTQTENTAQTRPEVRTFLWKINIPSINFPLGDVI